MNARTYWLVKLCLLRSDVRSFTIFFFFLRITSKLVTEFDKFVLKSRIFFPQHCFLTSSCSPNLVFLSQSVLSGDASMRVRLAHEISHAWFGLLVGAKDWSEEWLSEGFATFMEEKIQSRAEKVGMFLHLSYVFDLKGSEFVYVTLL